MFQSFTGNTRRPRQVNLSGQDFDPFAATSWGPSASGTKKTLAVAQQERQQRQQERERLNAAKTIQRVWRGHRSRRHIAAERRREWDILDNKLMTCSLDQQSFTLHDELRLLLSFFDPRNDDDFARLASFGGRFVEIARMNGMLFDSVYVLLSRLAHMVVGALSATKKLGFAGDLLLLLSTILQLRPDTIAPIAASYYKLLSSLLDNRILLDGYRDVFFTALQSPLIRRAPTNYDRIAINSTYQALGLYFLSTPDLVNRIESFENLANSIDMHTLSSVLSDSSCASALAALSSEQRLWLLAHFIAVHRLQRGAKREMVFIEGLSSLLSMSANDIMGRIDTDDSATMLDAEDDDSGHSLLPLPAGVKDELVSLVNKQSITELFAKFNLSQERSSVVQGGGTSALASYALILLRVFPRLGEDIRMWLYQSSISTVDSPEPVPALKVFWQAMSRTATFLTISNDPKAALSLLGAGAGRIAFAAPNVPRNQDWQAILLFLELYAFVLRFTDDEEFLNGASSNGSHQTQPMTRSRASALPLRDVKTLTIFLKNLSFTMYYHAVDVSKSRASGRDSGLATYFGAGSASSRFSESVPQPPPVGADSASDCAGFLGMPGMTFTSVRKIVTRVMRMLYERDSRRKFLPRNHWLMTSRFDMEGFIPAVVAEEERRHQISEDDGDEGETGDAIDHYEPPQDSGIVGMELSRRQVRLESLRRQQQKSARRSMLAAVGPRLEVLQHMPFVIPFETRVQIFRQFVYHDQLRRRGGAVDPDHWRLTVMSTQGLNAREAIGRHHAKIRRDSLFEDAYQQFYELGEGLKEPIQITFVDQFDTVEAGIDGGGVTKEFLTSVTMEAFGTSHRTNLFVSNDQGLLYPNPTAIDEQKELLREVGLENSEPDRIALINDLLKRYEFLGRVVGKCLYEGILVDIAFAGFFLLKWASDGAGLTSQDSGYLANINDLRDLDEPLYQGLLNLKNYPGNVEDFATDFTITNEISLPDRPATTVTRDLIPDGGNIPVSNDNRMLYISLVARYRLHRQPYQQTRAFLRGLGEIVTPTWLSMFNQVELQTLIGGDSSEIDVEDLRRNTQYSGIYQIGDDGEEHLTVKIFWQVMKDLDDADRRKVLKYVTSSPRAPLLGFSQLNPRFSIRDSGSDEQRLPSTSTCINLMKLPRYSSEAVLRSKLLYAVNSGAGFDLS